MRERAVWLLVAGKAGEGGDVAKEPQPGREEETAEGLDDSGGSGSSARSKRVKRKVGEGAGAVVGNQTWMRDTRRRRRGRRRKKEGGWEVHDVGEVR